MVNKEEQNTEANPPPYAHSTEDAAELSNIAPRPVPGFARCNWICIKRDAVNKYSKIAEAFVLDPALDMPSQLRDLHEPPVAGRKNIELRAAACDVEVDLWIVGSSDTDAARPSHAADTTVDIAGRDVTFRLHEIGDRALVLDLSALRNLTLALPRAFRGNLRVTLHPASDNIKLSPSLRGAVSYIHDTGGMRDYFIGEYAGGSTQWEGSRLYLVAGKGKTRLQFVDQPDPPVPPARNWFSPATW